MATRDRDESGVFAVLFAMLAVVLFVIAAMVVDLGHAKRRASRLPRTPPTVGASRPATCSSRSSVHARLATAAVAAAKSYAQRNYGITAAQWTGCTDSGHLPTVIGGEQCISFQVTSGTSPTCG